MKLNNLIPAENDVNWFNGLPVPKAGQYAKAERLDPDMEQFFTVGHLYCVLGDSDGNILKDGLSPIEESIILDFPINENPSEFYVKDDQCMLHLVTTPEYFTFYKYGVAK